MVDPTTQRGVLRPGEESSDIRHGRHALVGLTWQDLLKGLTILAYFAVWFWVYGLVNAYVCDPGRTRLNDLTAPLRSFPNVIQPYTAVIYVFGGFLLPALPYRYHWNWSGIRFVLLCYTLTSLIAFACYWVWPLSIDRPVYRGDAFGERLMLWVFSKDLPGNCFPSSHAFFATLGALLVSRSEPRMAIRIAVWALAVAVCVSTVTSGQHYFIDAPGGVVAALLGYAAARRLLPV